MAKKEFNKEVVLKTLINQTYQTGKAMLSNLDAKNKGENIDLNVMETYANSYMMTSMQLENLVLNDLINDQKDSWVVFSDTYNTVNDDEKMLFRGVIRDVKTAAGNVLSKIKNPFEGIGELPFYPAVMPYLPHPDPIDFNNELWQDIYTQAEQLEATSRYDHDDIDGAAGVIGSVGAVVGGYGAATANVPVAVTGAVIGAVAGGVHLANTGMEAVANWWYK